jgi:hypothetical protein
MSHFATRGAFSKAATVGAEYELGTERSELVNQALVTSATTIIQGWATYRYIQNTTGAGTAIAANLLVQRDTTTTTGNEGVVSAATSLPQYILGVTMVSIPDNYYAWVQCKGPALLTGDGAVAAGEYVVSDAAGLCDTLAGAEVPIGMALEADSPTLIVNLFG